MGHELFGNPITGYTTEFYSELIEQMNQRVENIFEETNMGLMYAKQEAYKTGYIPKNLRNKIIVDSKNLTIKNK